jgi:hypothetical protein
MCPSRRRSPSKCWHSKKGSLRVRYFRQVRNPFYPHHSPLSRICQWACFRISTKKEKGFSAAIGRGGAATSLLSAHAARLRLVGREAFIKAAAASPGAVSALRSQDGAGENFQFSAPIRPGNSGGAIIFENGSLAGIAASSDKGHCGLSDER